MTLPIMSLKKEFIEKEDREADKINRAFFNSLTADQKRLWTAMEEKTDFFFPYDLRRKYFKRYMSVPFNKIPLKINKLPRNIGFMERKYVRLLYVTRLEVNV